ncbi:hypothetical protein [Dyella sp. 2RAB6]|uniref:hypothetical protein n=1 Tax=Dyella sp. 2RAB6 TaxID=3232992 RepID=UPI003F92BE8C
MSNSLLLHILALAERIEPDREAIWEWFFRTPITPFGKTAYELGIDDQGDAVLAFLERAVDDAVRLIDGPAQPATQ